MAAYLNLISDQSRWQLCSFSHKIKLYQRLRVKNSIIFHYAIFAKSKVNPHSYSSSFRTSWKTHLEVEKFTVAPEYDFIGAIRPRNFDDVNLQWKNETQVNLQNHDTSVKNFWWTCQHAAEDTGCKPWRRTQLNQRFNSCHWRCFWHCTRWADVHHKMTAQEQIQKILSQPFTEQHLGVSALMYMRCK